MIDIDAVKDQLPPSLLAQLTSFDREELPKGEITEQLLSLLAVHDDLGIDELLVGFYLNTGVVLSRSSIYSTITRLTRSGHIESAGRGRCRYTGKTPGKSGRPSEPAGPRSIPEGFRDPFPPPGDKHKQLDWVKP